MAWNCVRRASDAEVALLKRRAEAFCDRHDIDYESDVLGADALSECYALSDSENPNHRQYRNWLRILRRTLKHPQAEGIAGGYVGYSVA